ncbi:hypothetical protein CHUAL_003868 [Chamberlinius hualienensis]
MGKDQELLDAARNGNVCVVEKILSQRAKRSGPLASLRRGPGANVQDTSGYTPLHHAALNGHKDIVTLLLNNDASPNVTDHKGSSPIHLGAWTGNTEIVKLLLIHSNVPPNVNLTNGDGDTPLHCAAQYGNVEVVNLLLQHQCDPTVRNNREETALDLAAQYGRLETVEALLRTHPELLTACPTSTRRHSALHLASRNGHKEVVKVLLTFGFPINTLTENGSGLHEAATFGKVDVVRLLLENGIDLELEDCQHRTALDILTDLNTQKAIEIAAVIQKHCTLVTTDSDLCNANPPSSKQNSTCSSDSFSFPKWSSFDGPNPMTISPGYAKGPQHYQVPPRTPRSNSFDSENCRSVCLDVSRLKLTPERIDSRSIKSSDVSSIYQVPPRPREVDDMSIGSSYDTLPTSRDSGDHSYINQRASLPEGDSYLLYQVPPPPRDAYKRISDPLSDGLISDIDGRDRNDLYVKPLPLSGYVSMAPSQAPPRYLKPPQKPPRKVASPHSPTKYQVQIGPMGMAYEYLCLASTGSKAEQDSNSGESIYENDEEVCRRMTQSASAVFRLDSTPSQLNDSSQYVDMKLRNSFVPNYENEVPYFKIGDNTSGSETERDAIVNKNGDKRSDTRQDYLTTPDDEKQVRVNEARTPPKSRVLPCGPKPAIPPRPKSVNELHAITTVGEQFQPPPSAQKPKSLDLDGKPYPPISRKPVFSPKIQQPPTPDFPPPSPGTAELGIHEKMRPLSQDYKRRSCDTETFTEDEVFLIIEENHQGELKLSVSTANKSVSTEKIESCSDSYAGLRKGCVPMCSSSGESDGENCRFQNRCLSPECSGTSRGYPKSNKNMSNSKSRSACYENVTLNFGRSPQNYSQNLAVTPDSTTFRGSTSPKGQVYKDDITSPFDEVAEWSKVNDIIATFGNPTKSNMNTFKGHRHYENINGCGFANNRRQDLSRVGVWLSNVGMGNYESLFLIHGFDDLQFMGGDMIEEQDLVDMGISISEHRKILVRESKLLPALKPIRRISDPNYPNKSRIPRSVEEWLRSIHLEIYVDTFLRHKFNDMERVMKMWEVELTTVLEITKPGHKKRILGSLGDRPVSPKLYDVNRLSSDLSNLKQEISQMDQIVKSGTETIKRNRQKAKAPVPPQVPNNGTADNKGAPASNNRASVSTPVDVEIAVRDPSYLFSGIPNSLTTQWRHRPDSLINGSCEYLSKYLGSTIIKELKGLESSKRSIQKLKKATSENIVKIPNVILAISYKGVKFIDSVTKNEICEHDIKNINCACQDSDHLDHFAYITKDHPSGIHYCHVFHMATMDLATELILTLGQAFEVAYQMALKENGMAPSPGITPSTSTSSSLPLLSIPKNGPIPPALDTSKSLSPEVVKIAEFPTSTSNHSSVSPSRF